VGARAELHIGRFTPSWPIQDCAPSWNRVVGGPDALLLWLETQLGLLAEPPTWSGRITEYAALLEGALGAVFARSLAVDRWATSAELLARRDALLMAGWDRAACEGLPRLICDMAAAEAGGRSLRAGEAERLAAVVSALSCGRALPSHRCVLREAPEDWPLAWQPVLSLLSVEVSADPMASGDDGSLLRGIQDRILGADSSPAAPDSSVRWVSASSVATAVEAVADALALAPELLSGTAVCCEDAVVALRLDRALARRGLPTMGAAHSSVFSPALQVLPLVLGLCYEPVDPGTLLEFVSLPLGPVPRRVGRRLAGALGRQPGLGSREWEAAVSELTSPEKDPGKKIAKRLTDWLDHPRVPHGSDLPAGLVAERCGKVAQWAIGRATVKGEVGETEEGEIESLMALAAQAKVLGDLAGSQGGAISQPQLARLLEAAREGGLSLRPMAMAAGGPLLIRSLAELTTGVSRLIWIGLGTGDFPQSVWSRSELAAIQDAGVALDDGLSTLRLLRARERDGLLRVASLLLAVGLPADEELRPHPLWLWIRSECFPQDTNPLPLEDLFSGDGDESTAPWQFPTEERMAVPHQPARALWNVDSDLLKEREKSSASSLEDRLACPLKWVLHYQAKLASSPIARLPDLFLLKGNFSHQVLEEVFGSGGEPPTVEEAEARVRRCIEERIEQDAAPLAEPAALSDRRDLRRALVRSARTLVSAMHAGGYRIVGLEVSLDAQVAGRNIRGYIDCLARRDDDAEAIIDFKYFGGRYRSLLEDGHAVQLATYAAARHAERGLLGEGCPAPAVAYLTLSNSSLHTPAGSSLVGASQAQMLPDAPAIQTVWDRFAEALRGADGWLEGREPVPARPLQRTSDWPDGADLVLDEKADPQRVCRYCDYAVLCGLEEVR